MGWEKKIFVRDLKPGAPVADVFALAEAKQGQARNGPFWSLQLQDASGRVEGKIWSPQSQAYPELKAGGLVYVEGLAGSYRDQVQISVESLRHVGGFGPGDEALADGQERPEIDFSLFVPSSPERPELMLASLEALCKQHLKYPPWRSFSSRVLNDPEIRGRLLVSTGAKAMHHAYIGGLLEHTLSVAGFCMRICDQYPQLDREILLAAAVCHDLGKAWELSSGLVLDYTDEGRLLGHIIIGLEILEPFLNRAKLDPELVLHFKHIIVSHHGEYEYGSPRRPKTAEAMALHYADNLDAKMHQFAGAFGAAKKGDQGAETEDAQPGDYQPAWSPYQRSLERFLFSPKPTPRPAPTAPAKKTPKKEANQCLLPLKG
jgi:3'-5' exoribonuclease